jgi:hypothetical protein
MTEQSALLFPFLICLYGTLAHGVMLLNDGVYWDGWMVESWRRTRNWGAMKRFFSEVGLPLYYHQHRLLTRFGARVFEYRLIAFVSTLLSALAVYFISLHLGYLDTVNSLLLALLYLSYTGYHMNVETNVGLQYTFPTAMFYWAVYAALVSQDHVGAAHWGLRLTALATFLVAFNANSLLVYYFGFLGIKLFTNPAGSGDFLHGMGMEALRNIDYVVLPFVYWVLKEKLTPRHGFYKDYNRLQLRPFLFLFGAFNAIGSGLEAPITAPIKSAAAANYLWIAVGAFSVAIYAIGSAALDLPALSPAIVAAMLCAGFILFVLAAVPYILVGQNFFPAGWATKHHMLFHLPAALLVLGVLHLLIPASLVLPVAAFVLALNMSYLIWLYLFYIAVAVKDRSWLHKLSGIDAAKDVSIFYITDKHSIQGDPHNPINSPAYSFYMFEWLWGNRTRIGFPVLSAQQGRYDQRRIVDMIHRTSFDSEMQDIRLDGTHANLVISDGVAQSPMRIAIRYLKERYLPGGNIAKVLEDATDVRVVRVGA